MAKLTQEELNKIVEAHGKWYWSNGKEGERANLAEANLDGANLYGTNLYGVNLFKANLAGTNLAEANLTGANLAGAYLCGANLARATTATEIAIVGKHPIAVSCANGLAVGIATTVTR